MLPLLWQRTVALVGRTQYSIRVFFQWMTLPVLGFAARKEDDRNNKLLSETHDTIMNELTMIKDALKLASEEWNELRQIIIQL